MKKRSLKASFVVTFAGSSAALAAPGCVADFTSTSNPPAPAVTCPAVTPNTGDACPEPGLFCPSSDPCGPDYECSTEGEWLVEYDVVCNPPPVFYCPEAVPMSGEPSCFGEGNCSYMDACGQAITAICSAGVWQVTEPGISCNPPAPCDLYGTPEDCSTTGYCRWLTPGCGDPMDIPALTEAGCYPSADCADDAACSPGSACKQFMVTPDCASEGCDACGVAVSLCL